jgi:hypothetical protein
MPYSSDVFKNTVIEHIKYVNYKKRNAKILDVGPGAGFYGEQLKNHFYIDCIEIHEPYVNTFSLNEKYNNVHVGDILDFDYDGYDYIIMGDVLEHIKKDSAKDLINKITEKNIKCFVAVPFLYEQGAWQGVESEIHHQPDLTERVMETRYPNLNLFLTNNKDEGGYAYYTNYHKFYNL